MTRTRRFALACTLAVAPACGPIVPDIDDSGGSEGSSGAEGSTTTPVPQSCVQGGEVYDEGETLESLDGCVGYRCENGGLTILSDQRFSVTGDLALTTQAEVDEQLCLSTVEGSLSISGTAADLEPLAQLTRISGTLTIAGSEAVTLHGLETLGEIGSSIVIADNAALTTLAFQPFMSVFGDVTIQNNDALASLAGAEFIGQCSTCAVVGGGGPGELAGPRDADAAEEGGAPAGDEGGADEPQGGTFYGAILIADNDVLSDVQALGNLWYAWSHVRFRNNAALTSLAALPLTEVQGDLEITNHASMSSAEVEAFAASVAVWGVTTLCGNQGGLACP